MKRIGEVCLLMTYWARIGNGFPHHVVIDHSNPSETQTAFLMNDFPYPLLLSFGSHDRLTAIFADDTHNETRTSHSVDTDNMNTVAEPSSHRLDEHCTLWWPLNHTELHIHNRLSDDLPRLRLKQRLILSCDDSVEHKLLIVQNIKPNKCDLVLDLYSCLNSDGGEEFHLRNYHNKGTSSKITMKIDYYIDLMESKDDQQELIIILLDLRIPISAQLQSYRHLILHKHFATEIEKKYSQPLHPWAALLESRDDLGFALQSLLPHAMSMIEIGVSHGNYASLLLKTAPQLQTYLGIDTWRYWDEMEEFAYIDIANQPDKLQLESLRTSVYQLCQFQDRAHLFRCDSASASRYIRNQSVDFIYIDAMHHYAAVLIDLNLWWPKLKPCGLFAGHDFLLDVHYGTVFTVKPAVLEFARQNSLLVLQTYDEEYPSYPTWFIYKPCG